MYWSLQKIQDFLFYDSMHRDRFRKQQKSLPRFHEDTDASWRDHPWHPAKTKSGKMLPVSASFELREAQKIPTMHGKKNKYPEKGGDSPYHAWTSGQGGGLKNPHAQNQIFGFNLRRPFVTALEFVKYAVAYQRFINDKGKNLHGVLF